MHTGAVTAVTFLLLWKAVFKVKVSKADIAIIARSRRELACAWDDKIELFGAWLMMKESGSRLTGRHNLNRAKNKTTEIITDCDSGLPAVRNQLLAAYQSLAGPRYIRFIPPNLADCDATQGSRSLKVALLREAIARGSYKIDSRRIASKLLRCENGLFS